MSLEDNIALLMGMGFEPEVAKDALERYNNNVEQAVDFIYSDFPSELPSYDSQAVDVVPIGSESYGPQNMNASEDSGRGTGVNHSDDYPNSQDGRTASTAIHIEDDVKSKLSSYVQDNMEMQHIEDQENIAIDDIPPLYSCFDDIPRMLRNPEIPPILMPSRAEYIEGYLAPLLMILCNVAEFRNLVLTHEFPNYGYAPLWWKTEKCLASPMVTQEIQRLVAFLTGDSHRAFSSIRNLIDAAGKVVNEDFDTTSDFLNFVFKDLIGMFGQANYDLKARISKLFSSTYLNIETSDTQSYKVFTVERSHFDTTIYRIMHSILWDVDFSTLGQNSFNEFSDVLTISFDSYGDTMPKGFDLSEVFYPHIYTPDYQYQVRDAYDKLQQNKATTHKLNSQTLQMRAYKGKKVPGLLEGTLKYLESLSDTDVEVKNAFDEISTVRDHITSSIQTNNEKINSLGKERQNIDLYDIDYLLGDLKAKLEPWLLTGIIINERQFCYLSKNENGDHKWLFFYYEMFEGRDYNVNELDFADLVKQIKNYTTSEFESGMVLIYVRESVFNSTEYIPLNGKLSEFLNKDNECLASDLDAYSKTREGSETAATDVLSDTTDQFIEAVDEGSDGEHVDRTIALDSDSDKDERLVDM